MLIESFRWLVVPLFAWAAWWDWRDRRVPVEIWGPIVVFGLMVSSVQAILTPSVVVYLTVAGLLGMSAGWVLWRYTPTGGADVKAIIAVSFVFPLQAPVIYLAGGLASLPFYPFKGDRGVPFLVPLFFGILVGLGFWWF